MHKIYNVTDGMVFDLFSGNGRVGFADPRKKEFQVIVDFGGGAYRGTRIFGAYLLLDRNSGRDTLDVLHLRLFHPA